jgi:cytoskeletal protein CcmA (bactofilin family)
MEELPSEIDRTEMGEALSAPSTTVVPDPDAATLYIGSAIKMKGSVEDCGVLQVDGHFEASAQSRQLKVSQTGIFLGDADVHSAEIVGRFEGNITVKDKLIIRATGVVTGSIRYGSIEIESGGRLSGDIQVILRNEPPVEQPKAVASSAASASPAQAELGTETQPPSAKALGYAA